MTVGILGATGFVGTHVGAALRARGDTVVAASLRDPAAAARALSDCDAIVNLAGEPVAQRWTPAVKEKIRSSRVDAPRAFLAALPERPGRTFVSASAIGYYGTSETATFTEASPPGNDFLADVCVAWEREAMAAAERGMRVAIVRTGLALGTDGGALPKLLPIFRLGGGGIVANGRQWYSWIHIDDLAGIYLRAIDGASGALNGTAPQPLRNADFTAALARAVHRPAFFPVPEFALGVIFGEGAVVVAKGQRVLPDATQRAGYAFRYADIESAFAALLG